jgi:hypothetical protein
MLILQLLHQQQMNDFQKNVETFKAAADFLRENPMYFGEMGYPNIDSTQIDGQDYLCVSYDVEQRVVQPIRLLSAAIGLFVLFPAAQEIESTHLKLATYATGLGMAGWSLWVWAQAYAEMNRK